MQLASLLTFPAQLMSFRPRCCTWLREQNIVCGCWVVGVRNGTASRHVGLTMFPADQAGLEGPNMLETPGNVDVCIDGKLETWLRINAFSMTS